ncbi:MAG: GNAT family N-acetyltransferase [Promethearchaeota archaeon]
MRRHIRYATLDDVMDLYEIESSAFEEDGFSVNLLKMCVQYGTTSIVLEIDAQGLARLMGRHARRIVGFVFVSEESHSKHVDLTGRIAHVVNFAIAPQFQGRGHGTYLMEIVTRAYRKNFDWMKLEVKTTNARAIRLYEKFGFKVATRVEAYYHSGADCYVMVLDLHS